MAVTNNRAEAKAKEEKSQVQTRVLKLATYSRLHLHNTLFEKGRQYVMEEGYARRVLAMRDDAGRPYFVEHFEDADREEKRARAQEALRRRVLDMTTVVPPPVKEAEASEQSNPGVIDISDDDAEIAAKLQRVDEGKAVPEGGIEV